MRRPVTSASQRVISAFHLQGWEVRTLCPLLSASGVHYGVCYRSTTRLYSLPSGLISRVPMRESGRQFKQMGKIMRIRLSNTQIIEIVLERLGKIHLLYKDAKVMVETGLEEGKAHDVLQAFEAEMTEKIKKWAASNPPSESFSKIREAYIANAQLGIDREIKFALQGYVANQGISKQILKKQALIADLRYPYEWFPATRTLQRRIILHVGPTNSGKSYTALKRLEQASTGVYAGPLRLLAHEVYTRLNDKKIPCDLVTGDERIIAAEGVSRMSSCTVEMAPINKDVEVAVVDEIQMIGDSSRGWAWTQAVMGLKAKELHLCGEERAVPLIQELAAAMGDTLEIRHYERLSPLRTMSTSLNGDLKNLRKGDCVVAFSRAGIHDLKKEIEKTAGKRVAVVYGSLPPEIRAQQANLFNDPDNDYDILVASDAIGMGLNLGVKRIVFESTSKRDGEQFRFLSTSEIKQIAGRAGRYRTAIDEKKALQGQAPAQVLPQMGGEALLKRPPTTNLGLVTTLEKVDLPIVQRAMGAEAKPIVSAGIKAPDSIILKFASYFPRATPLSYLLNRLHEIALMQARFHLCDLRDPAGIAEVIQQVEGLTITDRIAICAAPASWKDDDGKKVILAYARCIANQANGDLLRIPELDLDILEGEEQATPFYLRRLESLHKALVLYLWLSYRFAGIFTSQQLAFHVKGLVEQRMDRALTTYQRDDKKRERMKRAREKSILRQLREESALERDRAKVGGIPLTEMGASTEAVGPLSAEP